MKRKAQGAIEYLFMIAAALIIVAVVINYLKKSGTKAGEQASNAMEQGGNMISNQISSAINNQ